MISTITRKRPILPGETLPPMPPAWPAPAPQLPPVGLSPAGRLSPTCRSLAVNGHQLPDWAIASDEISFPQWGPACGQWGAQ